MLGLAGLAVLLGGCARVDLAAIRVSAEVPARLDVGESSAWHVEVVNQGGVAVAIQDLDLSQSLLQGVDLDSHAIDPQLKSEPRTVLDYLSLPVDLELAAGQRLMITLPITARPPVDGAKRDYSGDVDVCIDNFRVKTVTVTYRVVSPMAAIKAQVEPLPEEAEAESTAPPAETGADAGMATVESGQAGSDSSVGDAERTTEGVGRPEPQPSEGGDSPGLANGVISAPSESPAEPSEHGGGSPPDQTPPSAGRPAPHR